jgi:hypothetical protein
MRSRRLGNLSKPPRVENTSSRTTGYSVLAGVEEYGELGIRYGSDERLVALAENSRPPVSP